MHEITIEQIVQVIHDARTDPNSQTVVALRLALEEIDRQTQERRDHIEVQQDLAGATNWSEVANNHIPHDEIERRRSVPAPLPRQPAPDPELAAAFDRAQEQEEVLREAWLQDDEAEADTAQAVER